MGDHRVKDIILEIIATIAPDAGLLREAGLLFHPLRGMQLVSYNGAKSRPGRPVANVL